MFGYTLKTAIEIEFYIKSASDTVNLEDFFLDFYAACERAEIETHEIQKEVETGQYEISLPPLPEPLLAARNIKEISTLLKEIGLTHGYDVVFAAKPFKDKSGNGMHTHISIHDNAGYNLFTKGVGEDLETQLLYYAISGLCETMCEAMLIFSPSRDSFDRFNCLSPSNIYPYNYVPINVSWGGNNRTVAIRIPTSSNKPETRHIEHRVAGADANPYLVVTAIVAGITYGLEQKTMPKIEKVWGNAFDSRLDLPRLPLTLYEAQIAYKHGKIMNKIFGDDYFSK